MCVCVCVCVWLALSMYVVGVDMYVWAYVFCALILDEKGYSFTSPNGDGQIKLKRLLGPKFERVKYYCHTF